MKGRRFFAPGAIEAYRRQPPPMLRTACLAVAIAALGGLLAGLARAKGWL